MKVFRCAAVTITIASFSVHFDRRVSRRVESTLTNKKGFIICTAGNSRKFHSLLSSLLVSAQPTCLSNIVEAEGLPNNKQLFIDSVTAQAIDKDLMGPEGFSLDQVLIHH